MVTRVFVTLVAMMGIATPAALAQDLRVRKARTWVDCIVGEEDSDPDLYCIYMAAAFRRADGALYTRPYGCPRRRAKFFTRAPRWTGKLEVGAPL